MKNMSPKIYADKIFYFEGVIENPEKIIALIEETDKTLTDDDALTRWYEWTTSDGYVFGQQKQAIPHKMATTKPSIRQAIESINNTLYDAGRYYADALGIEYISPSNLSFSKYSKGKTMGPHVDSYDQPGVIPMMSGVVYLNDDMIGGEINFPNQNVLIKPKAGSIVIFPSVQPFLHESKEVIEGWKYISPVF